MRSWIYGTCFAVAASFWLGAAVARACPYSIRDSAFTGSDTASAYQLCFVVKGGTPGRDKLTKWVKTASDAWLGDTNVVAAVVDIDQPGRHASGERLRAAFAEAKRLPVAVVVSPEGEMLTLAPPPAGKVSLDWVMDTMAAVAESPARDQLREHLVKAWCVVILIEGVDVEQNRKGKQAVEAAAERITGTTTELDKVVTTGPHLVRVAANDPKERVLLWALGLLDESDTKPAVRAAMITGRGELRGPVLAGEELTAQNLFESFEMLGRSCSCTTAAMWLSGPTVPLAWGAEMDEAVEDELGFDLDDPTVIGSIRSATGTGSGAPGLGIGGIGYREVYFDPAEKNEAQPSPETATAAGPEAPVSAPEVQAAAVPAVAPTPPPRTGQKTLLALVGAAGLAMLVATFIVLRRSRGPARLPSAESSSTQ